MEKGCGVDDSEGKRQNHDNGCDAMASSHRRNQNDGIFASSEVNHASLPQSSSTRSASWRSRRPAASTEQTVKRRRGMRFSLVSTVAIAIAMTILGKNISQLHSALMRNAFRNDEALTLQPQSQGAESLSSSKSSKERANVEISNSTGTTLFYNIFIPTTNESQTTRAIGIVAEQLQSIQQSDIGNISIHYVLIAPNNNTAHIARTIEELPGCDHRCKSLQQVQHGNEELTLTQLHQHCQHHPNSRVVYIHSKGTYSATDSNTHLRRLMMTAVTSTKCNEYAAQRMPDCNVCSAHFSVYPFFATTGNFFVAQCSYVRRLLPPRLYQLKKEYLLERLGLLQKKNGGDNMKHRGSDETAGMIDVINFTISPQLLDEARSIVREELGKNDSSRRWMLFRPSWIGIGRNAMEHWVHSHPTIQPCDVHPTYRGSYELVGRQYKRPFRPSLARVPSHRTSVYRDEFPLWFQLPGRLVEWKYLYGAIPSNSSWIWKLAVPGSESDA